MFSNPDYAIESQPDELAHARRERQLHRVNAAPSRKDIEQDTRLRLLERENRRLECYVTALVEIMRNAGMIGERQLEEISAAADVPKFPTPSDIVNLSQHLRHQC